MCFIPLTRFLKTIAYSNGHNVLIISSVYGLDNSSIGDTLKKWSRNIRYVKHHKHSVRKKHCRMRHMAKSFKGSLVGVSLTSGGHFAWIAFVIYAPDTLGVRWLRG